MPVRKNRKLRKKYEALVAEKKANEAEFRMLQRQHAARFEGRELSEKKKRRWFA